MAISMSRDGMVAANLNDRVSALPFAHHAMAFGFRYSADRRAFKPKTRSLTVFERGIDDYEASPWVGAGYSTASVPANSVDITNAYKGGALSITDPVQILSIAVVPSGAVRIVRESDVKHADTERPTFPRFGGRFTALRDQADAFWSAMFGDLWSATVHASQSKILPPGNNTTCSVYAGNVRFMRETSGGFRPNASGGYYRLGAHVFVEPNLRNMADFNPNRISFDFGNDTADVPLRDGIAAPNDGDFAVIDMDVRVEFARVRFTDKCGSYEGVTDADKRKIAAWQDSVKADIDRSLTPTRSPFDVDPRVISTAYAAAEFQHRLARVCAGEDGASFDSVLADYLSALADASAPVR